MKLNKLFLLPFCVAFLLLPKTISAQHDSSYYISYASKITGRFYFSQKYTNLLVEDAKQKLILDYRPNTTLNMGIGATYKWFTLNLAYGFGFLNKEAEKGETKYLDLQAHFYGQKSNIDLFGQFYNGFYLYPKGSGVVDKNSYYTRPDLKVREFGGSYQYIFNHRKYSYRAAFLQNEWQKKSSGSFLLGMEFFFGKVTADSSVYPTYSLTEPLPFVDKTDFYEIGPNVGYTYSLIIARHFFITASLSVSLDYNVTDYNGPEYHVSRNGITPNSLIRIFTGYNSEKSAVSLTFTNSKVSLSAAETNNISLNTGNIRINYVRRFWPGRKTLKILQPIDQLNK